MRSVRLISSSKQETGFTQDIKNNGNDKSLKLKSLEIKV